MKMHIHSFTIDTNLGGKNPTSVPLATCCRLSLAWRVEERENELV